MNRPTLAELGVQLPRLVATTTRALPATPALNEARRAHARTVISAAELAEETQRACEHWIAAQERLGLDVLVDGALDGRDLVSRFAAGLGGFAAGGLVRIYGDRYRQKPVIAAPVTWREPITVERWRAVQALTRRPLKACITGPYTLMRWSFDSHYGSRDAACLAVATALRQELNALIAAGARVVQVDEPALAEPGADWRLAAEALRLLTTGVAAYVIAHTGSAPGVPPPGASALPVDNLELATLDEVDGLPAGMHATVDILGPEPGGTPATTALQQRLEAAVLACPGAPLWVSAGPGLGRMSPERAEAHLEAVARAVAHARGDDRPDAGDASAEPAADDVATAVAPGPQPAAQPPADTPAASADPAPLPEDLDPSGDR